MAVDHDPPLLGGERLAGLQHPVEQLGELLPDDLGIALPDGPTDDPRTVAEERVGGLVRPEDHVLLAVEDEHAGRQLGHRPGERDGVGGCHVGKVRADKLLGHGMAPGEDGVLRRVLAPAPITPGVVS
jgi:hypothetical protein